MAHDGDLKQKEWLKNKGKGPSLIELSNEVEILKMMIKNLQDEVKELKLQRTVDRLGIMAVL